MNRLQNAAIIIVLCFIIVMLPGIPGHFWDKMAWMDWSKHIFNNGLSNTYDFDTDYFPIYHYILWLYGKIAGSGQAIDDNINYLRLFTLLFDMAGLWYIYKWIDKKISYFLIVILCLLNPAYSYNTLIWGQVDGILSALVFISFYYGYKQKPLWSAVFMLLAINFKLQAIIFLPLWGLLYVNTIISKPSLKNIIVPIITILVVELAILWPFIIVKKDGWHLLSGVITGSVDMFPNLSLGAKNIWNWFLAGDLREVQDSGYWFGSITYKQGGLIMFFTLSFLVLLPIIVQTIKRIKPGNNKRINEIQWMLSAALIVMLFYYLNTQMHERYVHPAFIFIAAYSFYSNNFFALIIFSFAYFLNLEDELHWMKLKNYDTLVFEDVFISILYAITMIYLSVKLIVSYRKGRQTITQ